MLARLIAATDDTPSRLVPVTGVRNHYHGYPPRRRYALYVLTNGTSMMVVDPGRHERGPIRSAHRRSPGR
jgi:hypothetical protein